MSAAAAFDFSVSPFTASLAAFDPTVRVTDLLQVRAIPYTISTAPINFVVLFRHIPTTRVFAYDLQTNTWSDATTVFPLANRQALIPSHRTDDDDEFNVTSRLR